MCFLEVLRSISSVPLLPSGLRLWYWLVRQKRPWSAWFAEGGGGPSGAVGRRWLLKPPLAFFQRIGGAQTTGQ